MTPTTNEHWGQHDGLPGVPLAKPERWATWGVCHRCTDTYGGDPVCRQCGAPRLHRYTLGRRWAQAPLVLWIMLNPSTATATAEDPTVTRCIRRAQAAGYGGIVVCNLYAYRATDPQAMLAALAQDPALAVGPGNDVAIRAAIAQAQGPIVCAWGAHAQPDRAAAVVALVRQAGAVPLALALTAAGVPRHPLHLGYQVLPRPLDVLQAYLVTR